MVCRCDVADTSAEPRHYPDRGAEVCPPTRPVSRRNAISWHALPLGLCLSASVWADAASDSRFETCRQKLIQTQRLEVLYDLDWKLPEEPKVVVGPTFFRMPIDAKESFADNVNCFLMTGATGKCVSLNILHWQTGKAAGRFSNSRFNMK